MVPGGPGGFPPYMFLGGPGATLPARANKTRPGGRLGGVLGLMFGSFFDKIRLRTPPRRYKTPQDAFKRLQDAPKRPPRAPGTPPRASVSAPPPAESETNAALPPEAA